MLAIRVEYLTGVCTATRHDDPSRSTPEWPPHPDRLFSALVAAAAGLHASVLEVSGPAKAALRWLLAQGWRDGVLSAPQLAVSEAMRRSAPAVHLPTNPHPSEIPIGDLQTGSEKTRRKKRRAALGVLPVYRKKAALPIPAVIPEDPLAWFIWPDVGPDEHVEVLRAICQRVTYLGRSRSLVRVSISDDPPSPTHMPDPKGQVQLRVPGPGRVDYLVDKYRRDGGKPEPCAPQRYSRVEQQGDREEALSTVFGRCWFFGLNLDARCCRQPRRRQ